jgi:hypothetical protein
MICLVFFVFEETESVTRFNVQSSNSPSPHKARLIQIPVEIGAPSSRSSSSSANGQKNSLSFFTANVTAEASMTKTDALNPVKPVQTFLLPSQSLYKFPSDGFNSKLTDANNNFSSSEKRDKPTDDYFHKNMIAPPPPPSMPPPTLPPSLCKSSTNSSSEKNLLFAEEESYQESSDDRSNNKSCLFEFVLMIV